VPAFRGHRIDPISFALGGIHAHDYCDYIDLLIVMGFVEGEEVAENYQGILDQLREVGNRVLGEVLGSIKME